MMCSNSPVGSPGSSDLSNRPAGDAKSAMVSAMAACKPGGDETLPRST